MTISNDRNSETKPRHKRNISKLADKFAFPGDHERLPLHVPEAYQVAMGTGDEIVNWLRQVSGNTQAILIPFSNEASYRVYGPIFWHVANKLPQVVERNQRRKLEQLVDALTQLSLAQPEALSAAGSGAGVSTSEKSAATTLTANTE